MIAKFEEELPLYSLSSSDAARQSELLSYIAKITEGGDVFMDLFLMFLYIHLLSLLHVTKKPTWFIFYKFYNRGLYAHL